MSLATLKAKVEQLIAKAQNGGEDSLGGYLTKTLKHWKSDIVTELPAQNYFLGFTSLVSVDLPNLTTMKDYTFSGCTSLTSTNLPKVTYVGAESYKNCAVESLSFPKVATVYTQSFSGATNLKIVDFGVAVNFTRTFAFSNCNSFDTLILRGDTVSTLSNINNFDGGAFASGKSGGTIYVPSALVESYKTATNWSALYNAGRCNFVAIEGSEYE